MLRTAWGWCVCVDVLKAGIRMVTELSTDHHTATLARLETFTDNSYSLSPPWLSSPLAPVWLCPPSQCWYSSQLYPRTVWRQRCWCCWCGWFAWCGPPSPQWTVWLIHKTQTSSGPELGLPSKTSWSPPEMERWPSSTAHYQQYWPRPTRFTVRNNTLTFHQELSSHDHLLLDRVEVRVFSSIIEKRKLLCSI